MAIDRCSLCWRRLEDHRSTDQACPDDSYSPRRWKSTNYQSYKPEPAVSRKATREECIEQARDEFNSGLGY